jgi:hypothetical protein
MLGHDAGDDLGAALEAPGKYLGPPDRKSSRTKRELETIVPTLTNERVLKRQTKPRTSTPYRYSWHPCHLQDLKTRTFNRFEAVNGVLQRQVQLMDGAEQVK